MLDSQLHVCTINQNQFLNVKNQHLCEKEHDINIFKHSQEYRVITYIQLIGPGFVYENGLVLLMLWNEILNG